MNKNRLIWAVIIYLGILGYSWSELGTFQNLIFALIGMGGYGWIAADWIKKR